MRGTTGTNSRGYGKREFDLPFFPHRLDAATDKVTAERRAFGQVLPRFVRPPPDGGRLFDGGCARFSEAAGAGCTRPARSAQRREQLADFIFDFVRTFHRPRDL